jgi:hypothetical protein
LRLRGPDRILDLLLPDERRVAVVTEKQWDQIDSASVQKIFACCANPKAPECEITPIRGALPQK